ncbi:MAG: alpha-galactosidase [Gemmatimonadota bacterium]
MSLHLVLIGAGSREFGPATVTDILLSDALCAQEPSVTLMDLDAGAVEATRAFAAALAQARSRPVHFHATTDLQEALSDADFVIMAVERRRYFYWSQDFHIPRSLGFQQIYGENGGPGGLFHALRNMPPSLEVVEGMGRLCPDAVLLNYTNPLTKLCEAQTRLGPVRVIGLCHGVFAGMEQVAALLERPVHSLEIHSAGLNHFTWFTSIRDRETGADLYPELREREARAHWLHDFDEIALSRILLRTYGLWPSPGANHIGEYLAWAGDLLPSQDMQFFHDPADGDPWESDRVPPWIYNLRDRPTDTPLFHPAREGRLKPSPHRGPTVDDPRPSGELAIPIIEGLAAGVPHDLAAVNVPNRGALPGLPDDAVVELPAQVDAAGLRTLPVEALPEAALALLRTQCSINHLLVQAYEERSRDRLLQALLLDPSTRSYGNAVRLIDIMFERQADALPALVWHRRQPS